MLKYNYINLMNNKIIIENNQENEISFDNDINDICHALEFLYCNEEEDKNINETKDEVTSYTEFKNEWRSHEMLCISFFL
jgi:tRNA G10  N-methylase Trm11